MGHSPDGFLYDNLYTTLQNTSERAPSSSKRLTNIRWISELPRTGLECQVRTKQLLLTVTEANEEILIQYPGKESLREGAKRRPWDFFPRIKKGDNFTADLGFNDIWDILFQVLTSLKDSNREMSSILATLFYRMAYMDDHVIDPRPLDIKVAFISYDSGGKEYVAEEKSEQIIPWFRYSPNKEIVDSVSKIIPQCGGMSIEAFLHYNDLLAWNEDCKYFYRNQRVKSGEWIRNTGRVNTILTHISVIGFLLGEIHFADILAKSARQLGVAPASRDEIVRICGGLVTKA